VCCFAGLSSTAFGGARRENGARTPPANFLSEPCAGRFLRRSLYDAERDPGQKRANSARGMPIPPAGTSLTQLARDPPLVPQLRCSVTLELEQVRPLMLAAMQHFTPGEMKRLLRSLTAWGVRGLFVGGIGGGSYERTYGEAAVQIRKGAIKTTEDLFTAIDRSIPTDEDLKAAITIARVPRSNLARYYLLALERGLAGDKEPEL
jgi:hypothetical protein